MNILITGGLGFIGSYMADMFQKEGHFVGLLDRTIPSYFSSFAKNFDMYVADITKPVEQFLRTKYDIVVHLAAANDISSTDASKALEITTLGTKNCLDFCLRNGIGRFIYFSTFQVYGRESGVVDEQTPVACKNDYALTHLFAEEYVKMYHRIRGIDYIIVRPTNIFGSFKNRNINRWSLVPNCFIKEAFEDGKITLLTSGKQARDFISLADVSAITDLLCERFDELKNDFFNIAGGESITIIDVAEKTREIYERLFRRGCELEIKSAAPSSCEELNVSTKKINSLQCIGLKEHTIENEIVRIFEMLKEE